MSVTLTNSLSQTVTMYDANIMTFYGNHIHEWLSTAYTYDFYTAYLKAAPTVNGDTISLSKGADASKMGTVFIATGIDLTGYTTLHLRTHGNTGDSCWEAPVVTNSHTSDYTDSLWAEHGQGTTSFYDQNKNITEYSIDITNITGIKDIGIFQFSAGNATITTTVDMLWFD